MDLEVQWNIECMGNKFELFLFICMTQSPAEKCAEFGLIFILITFLK